MAINGAPVAGVCRRDNANAQFNLQSFPATKGVSDWDRQCSCGSAQSVLRWLIIAHSLSKFLSEIEGENAPGDYHGQSEKKKQSGPITIKKYANRRLYNTQTSNYITLDFLAEMTRDDIDFVVVDAKTGEDITHNVLTQIIVEEENSGQNMLPVKFLRQLISMYGDSMQSLMPSYLEQSMENFRQNQKNFRDAVEGALSKNPLGKKAMENQRQFQEAVEKALRSSPLGSIFERALNADREVDEEDDDAAEETDRNDAEIAELKEQLAAIQSRLNELDS